MPKITIYKNKSGTIILINETTGEVTEYDAFDANLNLEYDIKCIFDLEN